MSESRLRATSRRYRAFNDGKGQIPHPATAQVPGPPTTAPPTTSPPATSPPDTSPRVTAPPPRQGHITSSTIATRLASSLTSPDYHRETDCTTSSARLVKGQPDVHRSSHRTSLASAAARGPTGTGRRVRHRTRRLLLFERAISTSTSERERFEEFSPFRLTKYPCPREPEMRSLFVVLRSRAGPLRGDRRCRRRSGLGS